jgi:hypothetical protein
MIAAAHSTHPGHRMSLELFFVTRTPSFEALRDPDFAPSPAQRKLRQKLVTELLADYAGTELRGEPLNGWIDGLPGTLQLQPGYLLWSLKGIDGDADIDMVQGVIDWFAARALICEDPQDAGFGNRRPRQGEKLDSYQALVGAQLQSLQFDRDWSTSLIVGWILGDERGARLRLMHFTRCEVPQLSPLVQARVTAVEHVRASEVFDNFVFRFDSGDSLQIFGCVPDSLTALAKPSRGGGKR